MQINAWWISKNQMSFVGFPVSTVTNFMITIETIPRELISSKIVGFNDGNLVCPIY